METMETAISVLVAPKR